MPLVAWALRHAPRVGWTLGALTVLGSVWLVLEGVRWAAVESDAPWGPLVGAWPVEGSAWVDAVAIAAAVAVAGVVAEELVRRRRA